MGQKRSLIWAAGVAVAALAGLGCGASNPEQDDAAAPPPTVATSSTTTSSTVATSTTTTTLRPTTSTTAPPARVDFADAVFRGILAVEAKGNGLTSVMLSITSSAAENLLVTIAPATLFEAQARGVQNMVATAAQEFRISPGGRTTQTVSAACANMNLGTPSPLNTFAVSGHHSAEMAALLRVANFSRETTRVKQFAVWTISDNPSRWGYTGLSGSTGSGEPTDAEIARVKELFTLAGLDPAGWRGLR